MSGSETERKKSITEQVCESIALAFLVAFTAVMFFFTVYFVDCIKVAYTIPETPVEALIRTTPGDFSAYITKPLTKEELDACEEECRSTLVLLKKARLDAEHQYSNTTPMEWYSRSVEPWFGKAYYIILRAPPQQRSGHYYLELVKELQTVRFLKEMTTMYHNMDSAL